MLVVRDFGAVILHMDGHTGTELKGIHGVTSESSVQVVDVSHDHLPKAGETPRAPLYPALIVAHREDLALLISCWLCFVQGDVTWRVWGRGTTRHLNCSSGFASTTTPSTFFREYGLHSLVLGVWLVRGTDYLPIDTNLSHFCLLVFFFRCCDVVVAQLLLAAHGTMRLHYIESRCS